MNKVLIILLTFLGFRVNNGPKYDLRKKPVKHNYTRELNYWIQRNFYILCILSILFCLILFAFVCFYICGLSAVESGAMRNFIVRGV